MFIIPEYDICQVYRSISNVTALKGREQVKYKHVVILMYSEFASSVSSLYVQAQTHGGQLIKVAGQKGWI